jgi:diguanylate cyclase (GGDEF)-like protein/PAS domain S-box-containing protein
VDVHSNQTDRPVSVLLVDDREENRIALKAILSSPEYRLIEASSGAEALLRLLDDEFAVLLVDVVMPGMNGFELAAAIKERERTAAIPILFLTGQASDVDFVYQGYRAGAVDYLVKPLIPEMVRAKVAVFVELYRQRKRIEQQAAQLVEAERKESELRMIELRLASQRRYRSLAESVPHIIWTAHPDGQVDYFNHWWFDYTGVTTEQAAGSWRQALHPHDLQDCEGAWQHALQSGEAFVAECRLRRANDGVYRWHLCRAIPERGTTGQIISWLGTFTDIHDQKQAQAVLAEFKATLDSTLDAVMIMEPGTLRFLYVNRGATVLLGYPEQELVKMRPFELMIEHDENRLRDLIAPLVAGSKNAITIETRCRRKDEKEIPVEFSFQLVHVNGGHIVSIARDIRERKELEARLEQEARTDALTGCANRRWFLELAAREVARARRYGEQVALLMLDLDQFKAVNDRYGHPVGDLALKKVADVCREELREEDAVGRIGGEEFAILLPETDSRRALEVGERVRQAVAASEVPVEGDRPLHLTASIGATALRGDDTDIDVLLGRADKALYAAKEAGRNRVCAE